ncbi:MAG: Rne/Rng family ribonuclease, partial [Cytophagales bacterium]
MAIKIIYNVEKGRYKILVLKDNEIVDYYEVQQDAQYIVGDVYLGTIKRLFPSLNAVFVNIGREKDTFLHYSDVSPGIKSMSSVIKMVLQKKEAVDLTKIELEPFTDKDGKIKDVLGIGQKIIVQISKEIISKKGCRVIARPSLAGPYVILTLFNNKITISRKIKDEEERGRLERLMEAIRPNNFGVILRTAARGQTTAVLYKDLQRILKRWEEAIQKIAKNNKEETQLISQSRAIAPVSSYILDEDLDKIVVDDKKVYEEIKTYIRKYLPEREQVVFLYQGNNNIYQYLNIDKKIKSLLGKIVGLKGGGYLIIEQTEALCVIDVNTGNYMPLSEDPAEVSRQVNLNAVAKIAHLFRIRHLGGIIVIDFVGMDNPKHKREVYQKMKDCLKEDPVKTDVLPLSKFCLMEITRERVRESFSFDSQEVCPTCHNTGKIEPLLSMVSVLEEQLKFLLVKKKLKGLTVSVHPYFSAYLHQEPLATKWKWFSKYAEALEIVADEKRSIADYQVVNSKK